MRKKYYDDRKAKGLCVRCSKPLDRDSVICSECTEQNRIEENKTYHFYKENGICPLCKTRQVYNGTYCELCRAKRTEYQTKWLENNPDKKAEELERKKVRRKNQRDYRRENGLCTTCGAKLHDTNYVQCERCRIKRANEQKTHRMKNPIMPHWKTVFKEQGVCVVCGKPTYKSFGLCEYHYNIQANIGRRSAETLKGMGII
jgi:predicted amidophosphoribosyltransferase